MLKITKILKNSLAGNNTKSFLQITGEHVL